MKKLPCEKTDEEIVVDADSHNEKWKIDMANKKNPIEPFFPVTCNIPRFYQILGEIFFLLLICMC
jgi:hypothetical protein